MSKSDESDIKTYHRSRCCVFRKTKEKYGALSNMASGFPLIVNGIHFQSSEALYQVCRFPHLPEIQKKIIDAANPMVAKMVSKNERANSRADWMERRIRIMRWCLKVKLAQNYLNFGEQLKETAGKKIVEESSKDKFWGAIPDPNNPNVLIGTNALGRLLTELRMHYSGGQFYSHILIVEPPEIDNFLLLGNKIEKIDAREMLIQDIIIKLYSDFKPTSDFFRQMMIDFKLKN